MNLTPIVLLIQTTVLALTLAFVGRQAKTAAETARREAVARVLDPWFGAEMSESRGYLNGKFRTADWPSRLERWPMTLREMMDSLDSEDRRKLGTLVSFFDRVGWLAAEGVFPAEWIALPMQHVVKKTYLMLAPFILETRNTVRGKRDPIYGGGLDCFYALCSRIRQGSSVARIARRIHVPKAMYRPEEAEAIYEQELEEIIEQLRRRLPERTTETIVNSINFRQE